MRHSKLSLPYDIYERHRKVGEMIENGQTVLDVGGELNQLSSFSSAGKIVVANLKSSQEKSDLEITKGKLPFGQNSFDIVTAIDVLEHIPNDKRNSFTMDLLRVCKKKVIMSFPLGTEKHKQYELNIQKWLEGKGQDIAYLKEHITFGLPTVSQINQLIKNKKATKIFSGDLAVNEYLFKWHFFDPKIKLIRRLIYFLKMLVNMITNPILYSFLASRSYSDNVVRVYLVINKK